MLHPAFEIRDIARGSVAIPGERRSRVLGACRRSAQALYLSKISGLDKHLQPGWGQRDAAKLCRGLAILKWAPLR